MAAQYHTFRHCHLFIHLKSKFNLRFGLSYALNFACLEILISLSKVDFVGFYPITLLLVIPTGAPSTDGGKTGERDMYINSYKQNGRDDYTEEEILV